MAWTAPIWIGLEDRQSFEFSEVQMGRVASFSRRSDVDGIGMQVVRRGAEYADQQQDIDPATKAQ